MVVDTFAPMFIIEIDGKRLSRDFTHNITSFAFEDCEDEMDIVEITIADEYLQFTDDPLLQEGNEIRFRFGYVGNLSPEHICIIKEIEYDFPDGGIPTITLKGYDKSCELAGKDVQKVWKHAAPGIRYSDIAIEIAKAHKLKPVVTPTAGRHLRVSQSNISDAKLLHNLAKKSKSADGSLGYVFYVENNELHFHPRRMDKPPAYKLVYYIEQEGTLRSFKPQTNAQAEKAATTGTKKAGVDPRKKASVSHTANNATTTKRTTLGTVHVDANTGRTSRSAQPRQTTRKIQ